MLSSSLLLAVLLCGGSGCSGVALACCWLAALALREGCWGSSLDVCPCPCPCPWPLLHHPSHSPYLPSAGPLCRRPGAGAGENQAPEGAATRCGGRGCARSCRQGRQGAAGSPAGRQGPRQRWQARGACSPEGRGGAGGAAGGGRWERGARWAGTSICAGCCILHGIPNQALQVGGGRCVGLLLGCHSFTFTYIHAPTLLALPACPPATPAAPPSAQSCGSCRSG